jgi:zinc/manganese transport system substrate-binding protein
MRSPLHRTAVLVATALSVVATAACGVGEDAAAAEGVRAVASTDVYGDVVAAIGGDRVTVTSVLDEPSADPHSFEATVRTELAVSRADLVVENGGGYDDFMDTLVASTDSDAPVVDAVDVSGLDPEAEGFNEHVWYDLRAMDAVAGAVVTALGDVDPAGADGYAASGARFRAGLQELIAAEEQARAATQGAGVVMTEPVPGHLLDALGAEDLTPAEFSEAVEEGSDVSPAVLHEALDLLGSGQVRALVYNEQTSGPETDQVLGAARAAGVDVVPVTETLPDGADYLSWMRGNLDAVVAALSA